MSKSLFLAAALSLAAAAPAVAQVGPVSEVRIGFGPKIDERRKVIGEREKALLAKDLRAQIERTVGGFAPGGGVLDVTITDAAPNRPTWTQLQATPGLSYMHSFGLGGAAVEGVYTAPDGARTPVRYSWYETDITFAPFQSDWSDAARSFRRFAERLAKDLVRG